MYDYKVFLTPYVCINIKFQYNIRMSRRETRNKEQIRSLFERHHMLNVHEVAKLLPDIDFSIIYRNIQRFFQDGYLKEVKIGTSTPSYEIASDKHDHFICEKCDNVYVLRLDRSYLQRGFPETVQVYITQTNIHGICHMCK